MRCTASMKPLSGAASAATATIATVYPDRRVIYSRGRQMRFPQPGHDTDPTAQAGRKIRWGPDQNAISRNSEKSQPKSVPNTRWPPWRRSSPPEAWATMIQATSAVPGSGQIKPETEPLNQPHAEDNLQHPNPVLHRRLQQPVQFSFQHHVIAHSSTMVQVMPIGQHQPCRDNGQVNPHRDPHGQPHPVKGGIHLKQADTVITRLVCCNR